MSETSLNAKCGIEGFSPFQVTLPMNWDILEPFSHISYPNEINILKLEQLNHQMVICIYKGDHILIS